MQNPRSKFSNDEEEKGQKEGKERGFTKAILIFTNDDLSTFEIVEEFEYKGIKYSNTGIFPALVTHLSKDIEMQSFAGAVVHYLLSKKLRVKVDPLHEVEMDFVSILANSVYDVFKKRVQDEKVQSKILKIH